MSCYGFITLLETVKQAKTCRGPTHYPRHNFIIIGLFSSVWFILWTGMKPSRGAYQCQRATATNGNLSLATYFFSLPSTCVARDTFKGFLGEESFDMVYACGPEPVMRKVFDLPESHGIPIQACVERIIRFSLGLRVIGGFSVCRNGFDSFL